MIFASAPRTVSARIRHLYLAIAFGLIIGMIPIGFGTAQAATLTVNSTGNGSDANAGNGVCETSTPGQCTLRAAIQEANALGGTDTISFNIPTGDSGYEASPVAFRIQPSGSVLPNITGRVIIDATTQPEFTTAGRPVIVLDGSLAPMTGDPNGLSLNAGNSTIRGLVIQNFGEDGIEIDVNGGNLIVGNYIGTDVTGTLARPNGAMDVFPVGGISVKTDGNTIGGNTAADRNIISGNTQFGVGFRNGANNNVVIGNYIGTNAAGTAMVPNNDQGIWLESGSGSNTIGGSGAGESNLISGNNTANTATSAGIYVLSSDNVIQGNLIGTDVSGTANLQNNGAGIALDGSAANNLIGGTAAGAGNTIGFNKGDGVRLFTGAGSGNAILGNSIFSSEDPGLGIDLENDVVTANDSGDGDSGTNELLNFPVMTSAVETGGTVTVTFDLDVPAGTYRVEFFRNTAADGSGYGEGETFVSAVTATPGTGRTHTFGGSSGDIITATATRDLGGGTYGSTSEFSAIRTVSSSTAVTVNTTGDSGDNNPGNGVCYTGIDFGAGVPECTLRAAIQEANASATVDTIHFDIPAAPVAGAHTIAPSAGRLPVITATVDIDATTEPDYAGTPVVVLDGSSVSAAGLELGTGSDGSRISGLSIHSFQGDGLSVGTDSNTIVGNWIGADQNGTGLGNQNAGIYVWNGAGNRIGGTTAGDANLLADNADGIVFESGTGSGNTVLGNSIYLSSDLGIDLGNDGVTPNDVGDGDSGPNDLLNYPAITSASESGGTVTVTFDLDVPANPDQYRVEFFTNLSGANPSGYGDGETFVSAVTTAPGTGLTHTFSGALGDVITATATRIDSGASSGFSSTSEFSAAYTVTGGALDPVVFDNVQSGTVTLTGGSSSTTVTIAAVDPSRSFLTYSLRGSSSAPSDFTINGVLTNSTTLTFSRVGTSGSVTVEWSVVEFVSGVTVQRGTEYIPNGGPIDVAISSVDLSRTFVLSNVSAEGNTFGVDDFVIASLTSSTNLRLDLGNGLGSYVAWQVVQYNEAVVQRGTTSFASGEASRSAIVTAVDPAKSWLVYSHSTVDGSGNNIGQKLVRGLVTDPTTLTFDRSSTGQTMDLAWELVEFTDSTEVQHASVNFTTSTTIRDVTITAVDPARSIAVGGTTLFGGRSSYTSADNPGVGWFTTRLTSPTNLRVQRDTAPATADLGWFVIYWSGPTTPLAVNSTGDAADNAPGDGYCQTGSNNTAGQPACTLRAAIQEANANSLITEITFDIPASESGHSAGVWTISPGSGLPLITEAVTIDATTQTGWTSTPVVELNGSSAGASSDGLRVFSPNVEIRGFAINRFGADGIEVDTTSTGGVVIAGNHIGLDPTGLIDRGNGGKGIDLQTGSGPTTVGGTTAADRNVISGNGLEGIIVWGTDGNIIIGNYIGTDVTGNAPIPNTNDGLHVGSGADNNTFGQTGAGNVISGNGNDGIEIDDVSAGNIIQANIIGLGADGNTFVANGRYGVVLYNGANTTQIGGSGAGEGNVISGNGSHGVTLDGNSNAATTGNVIEGNLIGTDSTGLLDRGNGGAGIYFFGGVNNTTVGGSTVGHRNVISANTTDGIYLQDAGTTDTVIQGNYIGVDITGSAALPNGDRGVQVESGANNTIVGGTAAGEGNVISANGNDGIIISDGSSPGTGTTGTVVEGNLIGVGADGTTALGNGTNGVRVTTEDGHRIGGTVAGAGNTIAHNGGRGVDIQNATASANPILGNSIFANTNIGIDLGDDGTTANDSGDGDTGANDLLNFPVITSAVESGGTITIDFDLDVAAGDYRVEFFANPSGVDASGYGEGETLVHTYDVVGHPGGVAGYSAAFAGASGVTITSTNTEDKGAVFGSTSEFSMAYTVSDGTVTVNSTGDTGDAIPGNGSCDTGGTNSEGDAECTLRAAIEEANASTVIDTVGFGIPDSDAGYQNLGAGSSHWTIQPATSLPPVTADGVVVDATTQTSYASGQGFFVNDLGPEVELVGSVAGGTGLEISASNAEIRGLVINRFATGIAITGGSASTIAGNYIGTGVDGVTGAVGNTTQGILIDQSPSNIIGGSAGPDRNIISGNRQRGIAVDDWSDGVVVTSAGTQIINNYIGVDRTGTTTVSYNGVADQQIGIYLLDTSNTVIGTPTTGNVISGNTWYGIYAWGPDGSGNVIQNNIIGLDRSESGSVPNGTESSTRGGVYLSNVIGTLVGGAGAGEGNTIATNGFYGVVVQGASAADNAILGNAIYGNGDLGIDLGLDGVTVNDGGDGDSGPNDLLNYPVVTSAWETGGTVTVEFDLDVPGGNYRVEFFTNPSGADGSGNGEGESFASSVVVTAGTALSHTFSGTIGDVITATATHDLGGGSYGDTSEFSAAFTVVGVVPVANNDSATTAEDTAVVIDVVANDTDPNGDTLLVDTLGSASNGSVVDNGDGTVTYTPSANFNGSDSFTYTATDGTNTSNTATVTVTVTPVNDAPVANDDAATTNEDTAVIVDLLANDTDVEGDTLSFVSVSNGANGSVSDNGDGTVTYTPDPNWNGIDSFVYSITDGTSNSNVATVTVTVNPVDDPPVAVGDSATTAEDTAVVIDLVANDTDPDGDSLLVGSIVQPTNGTVTDNGDGTVTYTPDADYNGTESFTYTATDGTNPSNSATVWVTVTPVNDAPVAVDDAASTAEDTAVIVSVLANDTDVDGDTLSVDSFTQPTNGTVTDNGDGTLTYTPDANYSGSDSFTYVASDGTTTSNTATVAMTVNAVNDAPVASDDSVSTPEDTAVVVAVLANDADPEGDTLSIDSFTQPTNGTVTDNGDGTLTYTPDADYFGPDSFTYVATDGTDTSNTATVTVTVTSVNDAPVANDDSATTAEDTSVIIDLLGNDSDPEGDSLSIQGLAQPSNGTVTDNGDGTVTYTPDPNFNGSDPFTYSITDGADPSNVATVSVTVTPVNDAPVAVGDAASTNEDTAVIVSVLANDTDADGDALSVDSFTQPANGTVTDNGDGTVIFTPDADFNGSDSFTYVASDGTATSNTATVSVTVTSVNDAPVAVGDSASTNEDTAVIVSVLANDTDAEGDSLSIDSFTQPANGTVTDNGDGTLTYTPDPDFNGSDSFTYAATDGTDTSNTATVTITVTAVNDAPVANDDSATTNEDTAVVIDLFGNDSDPDADPLSMDTLGSASNGSISDNGDGTVTYTPDPDFNGSDSFTYTVTDGALTSNTATVTVTVTAVNDAPVADDDSAFTSEDTSVLIDLVSNDTDIDGDSLLIDTLGSASNGTVSDNGDGTATYTPDPNFNGSDSFMYTVTDGALTSSTATVTITVNPVNDAPVAVGDSASTPEDTAVTIDLVVNDTDIDGDSLLIDTLGSASNGTVSDNGDGTVTYTPDLDFNGIDSFTYSATDGTLTSNTATVTITVTAVNDAPVANDDSATTNEDTAVSVDLIVNDTDVEGDTLGFVSVSNGANGSVVDNGDGTVTYTPNPDFNGTDSFVYSVTDGTDNSNIATVTVTVNPVNDAPTAVDDSAAANEDTAIVVDVASNDTDPDGDALLVDTLGAASNGSVVDNGDGTVTYTPDLDFNGSDSFTYSVTDGALTSNIATVTVTVTPVNDAPIAVDDAASTPEDAAVVVAVVANDTDLDGDPLSIDTLGAASNGSVVDNGDGTVTYTPDLDFNGSDSFTYSVTDGALTSNTATVTLTVTSVGDAPVANPDAASTPEDNSVAVNVAGNDTDVDGDLDPTTTSITAGPANGAAAPGPFPGSITYTPGPDFNGSDSFTYQICDATALCDTAVVSITVIAVNDAPVAVDDAVSTLEDTAVVIGVLGNDTDVDGDPLFIGSVGTASNGTVVDNGDGTVTYTPDPDYNGPDSFTYTADDGTDASAPATVTLTIGVVNDAPVATDDAASTNEDTAVVIGVLVNDTDVEGDPLSVASVGAAASGSVVDNGDGTVTYTPNSDFNGADSFTYTVTDGTDTSNTATVTLTVTAVNDAPVAVDDSGVTAEDTAVVIGVLGNDSDVEGDPLSVASVGTATNGFVVDNGDGTVTYTPSADFNGADSFTYTVTDGTDTSNVATVSVTVNAVNDAPVAADDSGVTAEDAAMTIDVLVNDTDVEGDPLSIASVGAASNGTVVDNGDGTVTYTPSADFNGADSFTYAVTDGTDTSNTATVSLTVTAVNDAPVATDDAAITDEDLAVTISFITNDTDADADPLVIDTLSPASNGSVVDNGDGTFTYTPATDFNGSDSFTYSVTDGTAASNTATVSVTVNPINDGPIAIDDSASTRSDRSVTIDVVANDIDPDGDPLTVTSVSTSADGTTTNNGDGTVLFRPNSRFSGDATFTYTISDGALTDTGLVTIAVTLANTPPVVSDLITSIPETTSAGDPIGTVIAMDPEGDGMVFTVSGDPRLQIGPGGQVTLIGVVGAGDLLLGTVTVTDANGAATQASIAVTVTAVNSPPEISNQSFAVDVDANVGSSVGRVSASDPDGDSLNFSIIAGGPFSIDSTGRLTVGADLSSYGGASVTFSVLVTDPDGQSAGATVTVTVRGLTPTNTTAAPSTTAPPTPTTSAVNQPPVAGDDLVIGTEDSRKQFNPLSNDSDLDGDPLTLTWLVTPNDGQITSSNGYWFVPKPDWSGTTTAIYRVDDGRGGSDVGTVTFVINPVNDAPRIQTSNEPAKVSSGGSISIPLPSIVDPESDSYSVSIGDPEHGTAELDGSYITYTPDPGYEGQDTIQMYVVDTAGAGSRGVIVIEVVIDGATISVKILDLGTIGVGPEGGTGLVGAGGGAGGDGGGGEQFVLFGIPFFGLIASEVLSATWAVRAPLIAFVVVAAITLLATTRRSFSLAVQPLPVARSSDLTWSIVLIGEFERLPALSGPDHSNKAISWFDAAVTGIESTGNLMMTNGTLWVEVATSAGRGWVEARHVTPGRPEPTESAKASMVATRDELYDRIRHGESYSHLVSGRGLYMQVGEEIASVPQSRVDPLLSHILRDGESESKQLVDALSMPLVKEDAYEVPVELRNFEHLIVGEGWDRWALYFERGADQKPLLVGVSPARALVGA